MGPKRIVYVSRGRLPTEKAYGFQMAKMCEAFASQGTTIQLWYPLYATREDLFEYYQLPRTFDVIPIPTLNLFRLERLIPRPLFLMVYLVHSFLWSTRMGLLARREKGTTFFVRDPLLAWCLLVTGNRVAFEAHVVPRRLGRWLLRMIGKRSNLALSVTLTRHTADALVDLGFSEDRVVVLPDAVDVRDFADLPPRSDCRTALGLDSGREIVGYVGRFRTMGMDKGVRYLVEAAATILESRSIQLVCVGGPREAIGSYMAMAQRLGMDVDDATFLDRVPNRDVPMWIRACDVVTIPSPRGEFFEFHSSPLKLFEYMAAGAAIVASDLPALREVVTHEENALLVPPEDPAALADACVRLLDDPELHASLANQAAKDAVHFTWDARVHAILHGLESRG